MTVQALAAGEVRRVLAEAPDSPVAAYVGELIDHDEPEAALITLLENAPELVTPALARRIEAAFVPGTFSRPLALKALARLRERTLAVA